MVADDDILDVVEQHRDDLDRATKSLVSAANRGGGEDNITVIAFSIAADGDDTVRMDAPARRGHARAHPARRPSTRWSCRPTRSRRCSSSPARRRREAVVRSQPISTRGTRPARPDDARAARGRRSAARLGAGALSLTNRNRELLYLVVVGLLTGVGFAASTSPASRSISGASLTYAGFFFALYLAAHLVARFTVPYADPYVLPIAALLTAIGLTEIYRLGPKDAFRQATWVVDRRRGLRARPARPAPRLPRCSRTTSTSSASARSRCSSCRCCR